MILIYWDFSNEVIFLLARCQQIPRVWQYVLQRVNVNAENVCCIGNALVTHRKFEKHCAQYTYLLIDRND